MSETGRSIDRKVFGSYPDTHDVIKVKTTGISATGTVIEKDSIFIVVANGSGSTLPTAGATIYTAAQSYTMKAGDNVTLLGFKRRYSAIQIIKPAFADNATDFIVNGVGKNYYALNAAPDGLILYGNFQQVKIPTASTNMVVIAYRD